MILAIARPVAKKNLRALVDAFTASANLRSAANLVILAGQHARAEPEAQAILSDLRHAGRTLAGSFVLPPAHDTRDVAALYRLAARTRGVFVNPALFEPFGLTLLEAAQAGLPVVATRHGGPSAILGHIGHGHLVEPKDTDAIAAACLSLIDDRAAWDRASANALDRIGSYHWDRYAAETMALHATLRRPAPATSPAPTRILACDIDNTLTGCPNSARRFTEWACTAPFLFVVATGRSLPEARAVLRHWHLPEPDAFITSVGTELFLRGPHGLHLCPDYDARLAESWDRAAVQATVAALAPDWQPHVDQKRHKISLFGDAAMTTHLRRTLRDAGHDAQVIHSHDRLIDILPAAGGKANAIAALAARHGLDLSHCIAAGDSGNDLDMLNRCGTAIVVANASGELATLRPRAGLFRATHPHADGVLEGLERIA